MTSEQRKAVEILNVLKAKRDEGKSILNDDDYFFLMSFIFGSPVYVPQVIPFSQPLQPIEPYYKYVTTGNGTINTND